jgi:RimJ/RimL family protein N-acetyltransferase
MPKPDPLPRVGGRIVLRRLRLADLPAFQAYRHDEETGRYQGWTPQPEEEAIAFLEQMNGIPLFLPGEWVQLAIADRQTDTLIGDIGLCVAGDMASAEIGFTLEPRSRGRGLATEAVEAAIQLVFEQTGVARLIGITDARNFASIGLLKRAGMHRIASATALFRGEQCVEHTYALSRNGLA